MSKVHVVLMTTTVAKSIDDELIDFEIKSIVAVGSSEEKVAKPFLNLLNSNKRKDRDFSVEVFELDNFSKIDQILNVTY